LLEKSQRVGRTRNRLATFSAITLCAGNNLR
jgi:hypothetical protein